MSRKLVIWSSSIGITVVLGSLLLTVGHSKKAKMLGWNGSAKEQVTQTRGPVQNIRFTVYDAGIHPRQLRVRPGIVGISIEDRTGGSMGLLIEQINGGVRLPIGQVNRLSNQLRGRARFTLEPGRYRISNVTRQTSEAELVVEP